MIQLSKRDILTICSAVVLLWGCHLDTPSSKTEAFGNDPLLLEQLTSVDESERFRALEKARSHEKAITVADIERTLMSLRKKNVSTLIYLFLKANNEKLYQVGSAANKALENAPGSFPNIAYYYGKVKPAVGQKELYRLYDHYPNHRMAICLSIGEINNNTAYEFLMSKARLEKNSGNRILEHLAGLKSCTNSLSIDNIYFFLEKKMDREEVIALSEIQVKISGERLRAFYNSGGQKRAYAVQTLLGAPLTHFSTLRWIVEQLEKSGDTDEIRKILLSDTMRRITDSDIKQYRESKLSNLK